MVSVLGTGRVAWSSGGVVSEEAQAVFGCLRHDGSDGKLPVRLMAYGVLLGVCIYQFLGLVE